MLPEPDCAAEALPDARKNVGENKKKQQRIHDDAHGKGTQLTLQHAEVAQQQSPERVNVKIEGRRGTMLTKSGNRAGGITHAAPSQSGE